MRANKDLQFAVIYELECGSMLLSTWNKKPEIFFCYNGGVAHVRDAMALARKYGKNPHRWRDVSEYILLLSQPQYYQDPVVKSGYMRGTETYNYVRLVLQRYAHYRGSAIGGGGYGFGDSQAPKQATRRHRFKL